ncbi:MAG: J domain-containing protein [Desulfobacterales bacterium]|nr:J domain-containing protein [Desulfobacterales bacterium]
MELASTEELLDACGVLFGPEVKVSPQFLHYIQPSGIKAAFREKALETHPDRAVALGKYGSGMDDMFKEVVGAYEKLRAAIKGDGTVLVKKKETNGGRRRGAPRGQKYGAGFSDILYTGEIPRRELLFGRFLYYSGLISWRSLIQAITWQRKQRPLIGQIALEWGMLSRREIHEIIIGRDLAEKFGEAALRKGLIRRGDLLAILGKQRGLHRQIGDYFVTRRQFTRVDMTRVAYEQRRHNVKHIAPR